MKSIEYVCDVALQRVKFECFKTVRGKPPFFQVMLEKNVTDLHKIREGLLSTAVE